jgi:hypothetical protein
MADVPFPAERATVCFQIYIIFVMQPHRFRVADGFFLSFVRFLIAAHFFVKCGIVRHISPF